MSELNFTSFKQTLLNWPREPLPPVGVTTSQVLVRLRQIVEDGRANGSFASIPDLAVLIRQLLLSQGDGARSERLSVPRGGGWPDENAWRSFDFNVAKTRTDFLLDAKAWRPDWLGVTGESNGDAFQHEHHAHLVRRDARRPMDPFLREVTGFDEYVCPGQREAILSALFMRPGDSMIVNLPTGSGKSLVAQAPVLVRGMEAGLTMVVVPTTALALDLERRTRELLRFRGVRNEDQEFAWIGARSETSRELIKQRIRSGSQGILFASPEAVCGSLLNSLYIAVEKGLLAYLVIDEAHLIAQWGDSFRPAFQQLSGVRRGLLEACAGEQFRTLLLSATFSQQVIETLEVLFGPRERLNMVSAVHLRPEPRYLSYPCRDSHEKDDRVRTLVRHVPRPFILYTTKREDAKRWFNNLHGEGFRRIACVHGETPNEERERVIGDWVEDRLDGIVATSAFGVGMDKSNVRTIIHAALPETLDRFYQEVGRGGRDGCASLSITLFDPPDIRVARNMSAPTLIGDDKGYERWRTLYHDADSVEDDPNVRIVDLRKRPGGLTQESEYNRDWNMRTVILLARAGLIEIQSARPLQIERREDEDETEFEARLEKEHEDFFSRIPIRTLDPKLMDRDHFERQIGLERRRGMDSANVSFEAMLQALRGEKEMADVLVELFASERVVVSPACRGCPATDGFLHNDTNLYQIPAGIGITRVVKYDDGAWRRCFREQNPSMVVLLCPVNSITESVIQALRMAIGFFGVRELAVQYQMGGADTRLSELHRSADDRALIVRRLQETPASPDALPLARATVLLPWTELPFPDELRLLDRPLHLVFAPHDLRDSQHPLREYRDTAGNCIELQEFIRRAAQ